MLEELFSQVYTKFKMHFYREVFSRFQSREASLTAVETLCMEVIAALKDPTVNEFASFVQISSPNAAYKVNSLIQKGYLEKAQSAQDRREYHLRPTEKYLDFYNVSNTYIEAVMARIRARFSQEEVAELERMLGIVSQELMPEVPLE
ncbi:MAG: winged helix-turn-helix transcriptional regulator [Oscillospiraceae bacterium]|jgi:DNA-binding MarR family transcriptional regulator|nr:winged helix-turn-helix transcriptional regulator [Oscillospiraceae bacterium]